MAGGRSSGLVVTAGAALLLAATALAPSRDPAAYGAVTLDGARDAAYGAPIASDPAGDLADPGPGAWEGTAWTDLTALYCANDGSDLYVYADLPLYDRTTSSGEIGLAIDVGTPAGGSGDPWGNAISFAYDDQPDFVVRGNIPGISGVPPDDNNGWTELLTWTGTSWSGLGVNWGGLAPGGQTGSNTAYQDGSGVEFKLALSTLGVSPGAVVSIQLFSTQKGSGKGAYDTAPEDDQSIDWNDATTLDRWAACTVAAESATATPTETEVPPTSTSTATATSTSTWTPTATATSTATSTATCTGTATATATLTPTTTPTVSCTLAVPDVAASRDGDDVVLAWTDLGATYEVYHSSTLPYVAPAPGALLGTGRDGFRHVAALAAPYANHFYIVRATCGGTADSNRTGAYHFALARDR